MNRLLLRSFVPRGSFFHVGVTQFRQDGRALSMHTHDFSEVFLITAGCGLHLINGAKWTLETGDLCMIRPSDAHGFRAADHEGFSLVNVAFESAAVTYLQKRYFPRVVGRPWRAGAMPAVFRLAPDQVALMHAWVSELSMTRQTRLELDRFLLNVASLTRARRISGPTASLPEWLADAVEQFGTEHHMAGGPTELARLAGRCPEHVNRVVRRCLGQTTTDLVNEVRLLYAARHLRMTRRSIIDIVSDCGLENLAYFYRLFRKRFGMTPRQFRLRGEAAMR